MGGTGCGVVGNNFVLVVSDSFVISSFKETVDRYSIPDWLMELCAIPRRMKRPFPRELPGPVSIMAAPRLRHRALRRIKRLWRHA